ncbi:hypothetical protein D3C87_1525400 [compost metagenome]
MQRQFNGGATLNALENLDHERFEALAVDQVDRAYVKAPGRFDLGNRLQVLAPRRHRQALITMLGEHFALCGQGIGAHGGLEDEIHVVKGVFHRAACVG